MLALSLCTVEHRILTADKLLEPWSASKARTTKLLASDIAVLESGSAFERCRKLAEVEHKWPDQIPWLYGQDNMGSRSRVDRARKLARVGVELWPRLQADGTIAPGTGLFLVGVRELGEDALIAAREAGWPLPKRFRVGPCLFVDGVWLDFPTTELAEEKEAAYAQIHAALAKFPKSVELDEQNGFAEATSRKFDAIAKELAHASFMLRDE